MINVSEKTVSFDAETLILKKKVASSSETLVIINNVEQLKRNSNNFVTTKIFECY
jgi:hypothetical protein